jgi:hypothetical protein
MALAGRGLILRSAPTDSVAIFVRASRHEDLTNLGNLSTDFQGPF